MTSNIYANDPFVYLDVDCLYTAVCVFVHVRFSLTCSYKVSLILQTCERDSGSDLGVLQDSGLRVALKMT